MEHVKGNLKSFVYVTYLHRSKVTRYWRVSSKRFPSCSWTSTQPPSSTPTPQPPSSQESSQCYQSSLCIAMTSERCKTCIFYSLWYFSFFFFFHLRLHHGDYSLSRYKAHFIIFYGCIVLHYVGVLLFN